MPHECAMALPVDHHNVPGILPVESKHLQLLVSGPQMPHDAGLEATEIRTGIGAIFHQVMAHKSHIFHLPAAKIQLRRLLIFHRFLCRLCQLPV